MTEEVTNDAVGVMGSQELSAGNETGQEPERTPQPVEGQEPEAGRNVPVEILEKELSEARREAARYRTQLRELQAQLEKSGEASEKLESLRSKLSELEASLSEREMRLVEAQLDASVARYCASHGIADVEAVQALVRLPEYYSSIEFEGGAPKNLQEVLENIVQKRPYLRGAASISPTNPSHATLTLSPGALRDHSVWRQHKDEILRLLGE